MLKASQPHIKRKLMNYSQHWDHRLMSKRIKTRKKENPLWWRKRKRRGGKK
jgi:hypothetical protein